MTLRKRPKTDYTILPDVAMAIAEAARLSGAKSASRFVEDTMMEKATAIIFKHAQSQSLDTCSNQSTNHK